MKDRKLIMACSVGMLMLGLKKEKFWSVVDGLVKFENKFAIKEINCRRSI